MSAWWESEAPLAPIAPDSPCGEDVEYTLLPALDVQRVFGRSRRVDEPEVNEQGISVPPPDWGEIRQKALDGLERSKDLRLLTYLGAALLRTEGIEAFARTLSIASRWLETFWAQVYPLVDEDALLRRNALNCFADPMAVVDALRRAPIVSSRQHGIFSLRDLDLASGALQPGENEARADEGRINAAFAEMPLERLKALHERASEAVAALKAIDATMGREGGVESVPAFDPLSAQFVKLERALRLHLTARDAGAAVDAADEEQAGGDGAATVMSVGAIRSRQDALRALDAVAEFFRRNEPSSPVPLFVERAKRLVSKSFLEVLADIAPDGLPQARSAGGVATEGE